MKKLWIPVFFALFALSGCEMAADMGHMMGKMDQVNESLKTELNLDAQVGWNIQNGTLAQVTVILPGHEAGEKTTNELKDLVYPIIRKHFEKEPQVFQLVVTFPIAQ